jgi:hypothetical protein
LVSTVWKTLLKKFKAVHDYNLDIIKIPKDSNWVVLQNQHKLEGRTQSLSLVNSNSSNTQHINFKRDHHKAGLT